MSCAFVHQADLVNDHVPIFFGAWRAEFHCANLAVLNSRDLEHLREATLPQLLVMLYFIEFCRVRGLDSRLPAKLDVDYSAHLCARVGKARNRRFAFFI
mmetsp:Transcript_4799/g.6339  ORF Transcript_4799/g.6339 Transcript_4799/m.6339 type:complete len:99 (-) Transcript_4799:440-736(-)